MQALLSVYWLKLSTVKNQGMVCPLFGLLNVDKPPGLTSRQVVNRIERLVRPTKVGHAGTLDPLATGVLILCLGPATRLIEYVQRMRKRYRATFLLGRKSPSDDTETRIELLADPPIPSLAEIQAASVQFVGTIQQRPPDYSAVHVDGKRAYRLARQGQSFELTARPVDVYSLRVERYDYPELQLDIECGSGTYIRSLGRDLAAALDTAAVMSALVRTAIGPHTLANACNLDELNSAAIPDRLRPPIEALAQVTMIRLNDDETLRVVQGQSIRRPTASDDAELAATDPQGNLLAILQRRCDGSLSPHRVFRA